MTRLARVSLVVCGLVSVILTRGGAFAQQWPGLWGAGVMVAILDRSGTSQAAGHVFGAIAQALQLQLGPSFAQGRSVLQPTAMDLGYPHTQQGQDGSMPRTWWKHSNRRNSRRGAGGNV
jgi:hypothetical protein